MSRLKRVLFVCIGNACRSQMAEAFARAYGSDVLIPFSAGLAPAEWLPEDTIHAMDEKNLDIRSQAPKSVSALCDSEFDLVINMSGFPLPHLNGATIRTWNVEDPIAMDYENHCRIRDQIEKRVTGLIRELRRQQK